MGSENDNVTAELEDHGQQEGAPATATGVQDSGIVTEAGKSQEGEEEGMGDLPQTDDQETVAESSSQETVVEEKLDTEMQVDNENSSEESKNDDNVTSPGSKTANSTSDVESEGSASSGSQEEVPKKKRKTSSNGKRVGPHVQTLKKSGEAFVQTKACVKIKHPIGKCMECKYSKSQPRACKKDDICRFYSFRKLRYTGRGSLTVAGFPDWKECKDEDLILWMPDKPPEGLNLELAKYLLGEVGDQFCELVKQEKGALVNLEIQKNQQLYWRKAIDDCREMCDVCKTTIFNYHWTCRKCGFLVCVSCIKTRSSNNTIQVSCNDVNISDQLQDPPSCIHVVPTQNHNVTVLNSNEPKTSGAPPEDYQNNLTASVCVKNDPPTADECLIKADVKETKVIFSADFNYPCSSGKENSHLNENGSATFLISTDIIGATEDVSVISSEVPFQVPLTKPSSALSFLQPSASSELAALCSSGASSVKNTLSQPMTKQICDINNTIEDIHNLVQQTIDAIREVERSWLNPGKYIKQKSRRQKELFQLLDFIADTVKLVNKPSFASRLYKEDQHEIVAVLDPVFREVTACYVTLCEFHDRVTVDAKYLEQLVSGFPKRSLVIQDWVSDPSIDEALDEVEQHQYTTGLDVDVEELFS